MQTNHQLKTKFGAAIFACVPLFCLLGLGAATPAFAEENSGFLQDYSDLGEVASGVFSWKVDDAEKRLANYDSIMIDQPEFILAGESHVAGLKPDQIKLISDTLRKTLMDNFERSSYRLVSSPGPKTLYLRTGITHVQLDKKRMRLVQFTPIGLVATVATAPLRDIMDKLVLEGYAIEAELLDSSTENRLAKLVDRSQETTVKDSWDSVMQDLNTDSQRMKCRLENARLGKAGGQKCVDQFPYAN